MGELLSEVKAWVKTRIRKSGFDLSRKTPNVIDFLSSRNIETVFDVGANVGQYARSIRSFGYSGEIISFEPVKAIYAELEKSSSRDPKWTTRNVALGSSVGAATINVSQNSVFSSILEVAAQAEHFDEKSRTSYTEVVNVERLDSYAQIARSKRCFLKIDTQGFEQHVLRGGGGMISSLYGIQLELPVVHLYEGVWSMEEALRFMGDHGFTLAIVVPVNFHAKDACSVVELDCVFRRSNLTA